MTSYLIWRTAIPPLLGWKWEEKDLRVILVKQWPSVGPVRRAPLRVRGKAAAFPHPLRAGHERHETMASCHRGEGPDELWFCCNQLLEPSNVRKSEAFPVDTATRPNQS